jgi:hypothetical protein
MSYKPDEKDWMAYLYGELEGEEKERFDQYLLSSQEARTELEKYKKLRGMLSSVEDKEVIAPPIVIGDSSRRFLWDVPYFRTIISIAASLLILIVAGKLTGTRVSMSGNEFRLSFGAEEVQQQKPAETATQAALTAEQVRSMIDESLKTNNQLIETEWKQNQDKLASSIRTNLAANSNKIDELVRQASAASQDQIREYVAGIQTQNMQLVKDYFQLTSTEQKDYIEDLLVDFADYLQQQRNNDLQLVQTRLNSIEQNTDLFKQETEQILTSIITTVGSPESRETKN